MSKKWIKYWRNSLADGERMEQNLQKVDHFKMEQWDIQSGHLPSPEVNQLIDKYEIKVNREKGIEDRNDEEWIEINEIPIIIAPFTILPIYEHAKKATENDKIYPYWFNAKVNRGGITILPESKFPTFIRRALDPAIEEDQILALSSVSKVDEIMGQGLPDLENWKDYAGFVGTFFKKITGSLLGELSFSNLQTMKEVVVALDDKIEGASDGIIKLYDKLSAEDELPNLIRTISDSKGQSVQPLIEEKSWSTYIASHLGQMGDKFPLSFTQRQSLIHYSTLKHGDALAVNGPPGTGKTTLLQSVVAHEYVKSAIKGKHPFVMVACSTNNQAVTNIIDSFGKADSSQKSLAERWLPEINSYALYLPSSSREPKKGTQYTRINREGLPSEIETPEYIERAKSTYLKKASTFFEKAFQDTSEVIDHIHKNIIAVEGDLKEIQEGWQQYLKIEELLKVYAGDSLQDYFINNTLNLEAVENDLKEHQRLLNQFYDIKEAESFWLVFLSFIKFFREKRIIPYKRMFQDTHLEFPELDFKSIDEIEKLLNEKIDLLKNVLKIEDQWSQLKAKHELRSNPPGIFSELDQSKRHQAFLLATHYWEGRWIKETEAAIDEDILKKVGEINMKRKFRRYAMLCPCFVATFYMLPKFFIYKKHGGGTFPEYPLLDFIDMLIVDEAGQVTPEVGAASFALAKKALVVGDIKQIDPIWKIPKSIDHSNLEKFDVIENGTTSEKLDIKGFTASAGSVMRLAQNASYYHAATKEAKGMMLVEHRRCYDEIIAYCNDLAYHGLLKPLRGNHKKDGPLPPLGIYHVDGNSSTDSGSRMNEIEAVEIVKWLVKNKASIESFYSGDPKKTFEDHVGIITPFTAQKQTLKRMLKKAGFDIKRLTVGTVHALQGAERSVIIFSPVYASNESGRSFFFDRGVNMLNVAVSRAKDSFLLFGDTKVLNPKAQSPSGLLMRHLMKNVKV